MNIFTKISVLEKNYLGRNYRNKYFVRPLNSRKARRVADSKILCKKIMRKYEVPTANTYKIIYSKSHLEIVNWNELPRSFALKPNEGTHGHGIIIFIGKKRGVNEWIRTNGQTMGIPEIKRHINEILDGKYSLGGRKDIAFFEELIINHPSLKPYTYKGLPDVRIIVYNKIPIMAMLRLPTKESEGKANLHAGCIGVGVDISTGITTHAIHRPKFTFIPDYYAVIENMTEEPYLPLRGIKVPFWNQILKYAVKAQEASGLGYTGVDISIDKVKGPMILELNARPGLGIQVANRCGLKERLERVKDLEIKDVDHGIKLAKTLFGGVVEQEIESISGKQIIYPIETLKLIGLPRLSKTKKLKKEISVERKIFIKSKMDSGQFHSFIDISLASTLGYESIIEKFEKVNKAEIQNLLNEINKEYYGICEISNYEELNVSGNTIIRPILPIRIILEGVSKTVNFRLRNRKNLIYPVILGRKDLREFLIDPSSSMINK